MKLRLKWFELSPRILSISSLGERMLASQYNRRRSAGFKLDTVRRDFVSGVFLERIEWEDEVEDPAEGILLLRRVEVRQTQFRISASPRTLELLNPPRSVQPFVDHLSQCADQDVRLKDIPLTPEDWLASFQGKPNSYIVTSITTAGITLSSGTSATISISGSEDVRKYLKQFATGRTAYAERLTMTIPRYIGTRIELQANARACVLEGGEAARAMLRGALEVAIRMRSGQ